MNSRNSPGGFFEGVAAVFMTAMAIVLGISLVPLLLVVYVLTINLYKFISWVVDAVLGLDDE